MVSCRQLRASCSSEIHLCVSSYVLLPCVVVDRSTFLVSMLFYYVHDMPTSVCYSSYNFSAT